MGAIQRMGGKVVVITGAASGIGLASVRLFAAEGARVIAVDRPGSGIDTDFLGTPEIAGLAQDVTTSSAPNAIVDFALQHFGAIDVLFNNAGIVPVSPVETMSDELWHQVFAVNLDAVFRLCRQAIPALKARARDKGRARVINTASIMAAFAEHSCSAYAASKHAVAGFTKSLAMELGEFRITANYILPGAIVTGLTDQLFAVAAVRQEWERSAALKRLGEPIDIARAALLLASDEADFITGHGLVADGGLSLHAGPLLPH